MFIFVHGVRRINIVFRYMVIALIIGTYATLVREFVDGEHNYFPL
jgi:hypothetical protein